MVWPSVARQALRFVRYSPSTRRRCSSRISSAVLRSDSRTSSVPFEITVWPLLAIYVAHNNLTKRELTPGIRRLRPCSSAQSEHPQMPRAC